MGSDSRNSNEFVKLSLANGRIIGQNQDVVILRHTSNPLHKQILSVETRIPRIDPYRIFEFLLFDFDCFMILDCRGIIA